MSESDATEVRPKNRNRIVAFVDILGASQAALSGQTSALVGDIFRLGRTLRWTHRIHSCGPDGIKETQEFRPGVAQFSDCLLIWSDPLDGLPPEQFVRAAGAFLWNLCAEMGRLLLADVPFRAGVSEGPVFIHPELNIYAGRPIVEAAKLEGRQDWLGAAMLFSEQPDRLIQRHDQIYLAEGPSMFDLFVMPEMQVPLKQSTSGHLLGEQILALNWALSVQESQGPSYIDMRQKLEALQLKAGAHGDDKYKLALQFLAVVEQKHPIVKSSAPNQP